MAIPLITSAANSHPNPPKAARIYEIRLVIKKGALNNGNKIQAMITPKYASLGPYLNIKNGPNKK